MVYMFIEESLESTMMTHIIGFHFLLLVVSACALCLLEIFPDGKHMLPAFCLNSNSTSY